MKSSRFNIPASAAFLLLLVTTAACADTIDKDWTFSTAGNYLGWSKAQCPDISAIGVEDGYLWATTTGTIPWIIGPDNIAVAASTKHYVSVRMRMHLNAGPTSRFGPSVARMYFATTTETSLTDKYVEFRTYGNAEWKTYNIMIGNHAKWTGTIKRLRLHFCSNPDARVEIAWIRIVQDQTPPEFELRNMWNPRDNDTISTNTPTITLRKIYDDVSGLNRCDFYHRPGSSTSNADWVYAGSNFWAGSGFQLKYPEIPNGTYDFGVRVYDNAGNRAGRDDGIYGYLDDITINPEFRTALDVDASNILGETPREIPGNNTLWVDFRNKYDPLTGRLSPALEALVADMLIGNMRYAGADEFEWKDAIGPVESRPPQLFWGSLYVPKFGIDEFLRYCKLHNIEPTLGVKFRWPGAPGMQPIEGDDPYAKCLQDAIDLVEYCNSPNDGSNPNGGTDWAAVRAANGHPEPYNVKWFELGNEPWGYDTYGSPSRYGYTIDEAAGIYGAVFFNYQEGMMAIDPSIVLASTAYHRQSYVYEWANPDWPTVVNHMNASKVDVIQVHPYLPYSAWQKDLNELYLETMATPKYIDEYINMQRALTRITAPEKTTPTKLRINEWNINYNWIYDPSVGRINTWHTKTLKAAVAAADAIRIFIENRDVVESTGWWHLYNGGWECISSNDTTVRPIYHVYRMLKHHLGDKLVASVVRGSPTFDFTKENGGIIPAQWGVPCITAFASKSGDGDTLYLMVINAHKTDAVPVDLNIGNFMQQPWTQLAAEIWELNGPDVDDYLNPADVKITESTARFQPRFTYSFPAHSVTTFKLTKTLAFIEKISDIKDWSDQTSVFLSDKVVTRKLGPSLIYVEEPSRLAGIRVSVDQTEAQPHESVLIRGRLSTTPFGERYISAEQVESRYLYGPIAPWSMNHRSLVSEPPVSTGLLVRVWGITQGAGEGFFFIHDGSNVGDPSSGGAIKVYSEAAPENGAFVCVTGVKSLDEGGSGQPVTVILTGSPADVQVVHEP